MIGPSNIKSLGPSVGRIPSGIGPTVGPNHFILEGPIMGPTPTNWPKAYVELNSAGAGLGPSPNIKRP